MANEPLTEFQVNIINRYIDKYPDVENVLLEKYNAFLIHELPTNQFENIMDEIHLFISKSFRKI